MKPVLLVVDDEKASLSSLEQELRSRYGLHYRIISSASAEEAAAHLEELRLQGTSVPLVLADQWMPGWTGIEFLSRVRELHPTARRGLLISWGDRSATAPILEAAALGQIEFYVPKPAWSPDEQFHETVTEALEEWWRLQGGRFEAVTVVGDYPSPQTHEIRDLLTRNSVPFGFHTSDSEEGRLVLQRLGLQGTEGTVVALYNGVVLVDPDRVDVAAALGVNVRPAGRTYDVIIIGAGPAGLAAAVYGASEGLTAVVLEREAFGGQAGTTSLIRNYLGFPRGISGGKLAWRAYEQAWIFGTDFIYGNPATALTEDGTVKVLRVQDGGELRGRAVVIATGTSYRRLDVPSLESLVGAGVFYGPATVEAQAVVGKHAYVVGGGNSAGQAALHLAKYAERVTMLVRSGSLATSMSEYLVREIHNARNVEVRHGVEVVGGGGKRLLQHLELRQRGSGKVERVPAAALFVLIGAEPFTDWLPESVSRDAWGFVLTGPDVAERWSRERPPLLLESSVPGVFAVGDVRHGSMRRVASAVGEGSVVIRMVHDYLAGEAREAG
jgi:thioredoxin reductase (NADPH)